MTSTILLFLKKYWAYIIAILAVLAFIGHYNGLKKKIKELEEVNINLKVEISTLEQQISACQQANEVFQQEIEKFNQSISKWSEVSQKQLKEIDSLKIRINASQATTALRIKNILENPNKPQSCEEAIKYLIDAGRSFQQ